MKPPDSNCWQQRFHCSQNFGQQCGLGFSKCCLNYVFTQISPNLRIFPGNFILCAFSILQYKCSPLMRASFSISDYYLMTNIIGQQFYIEYNYINQTEMGNLCCEASPPKVPAGSQIQVEYQQTAYKKLQSFLSQHPNIQTKLKQIRENIQDKEFLGYNRMIDNTEFLIRSKAVEFEDGVFLAQPEFQGSEKYGFGIMLYNQNQEYNSTYYEGYWRINMRDQWGIYISEDGDVYVGGWKNDMPHGKGHYKSDKNKREYFGDWEFGEKNGRGRQIYPDGSECEGDFKDNAMDGEGVFKSREQRYEGGWKNGLMDGAGQTQWYDQKGNKVASYIGEYKCGKKQGFGQYTDSKGKVIKATWHNGTMKQNCPKSIVALPTN